MQSQHPNNASILTCQCDDCRGMRDQDAWDRAIARAEEPDIDFEEEPTC